MCSLLFLCVSAVLLYLPTCESVCPNNQSSVICPSSIEVVELSPGTWMLSLAADSSGTNPEDCQRFRLFLMINGDQITDQLSKNETLTLGGLEGNMTYPYCLCNISGDACCLGAFTTSIQEFGTNGSESNPSVSLGASVPMGASTTVEASVTVGASTVPVTTPPLEDFEPFPVLPAVIVGVVAIVILLVLVTILVAACFLCQRRRKQKHKFAPTAVQEPPHTYTDGPQGSKAKPEDANAPFYLPIVEPSEVEDTYEDVEVPKEDDRYTALSALTADKKDNSSQYTALIKTPSQTVQRSDNQSRDIPLATTLPSVHKSDQKVKNSAEIEPYDYVSFEISGSQTKSRNSDSAALAQTALAQNQEAIYY